MEDPSFQTFLSQVASRLRHDLKGGLITLRMGMESLSDDETLKPLLLGKAQELVSLSDKLVLLLRMGSPKLESLRPEAVFAQAARHAEDMFPPLQVTIEAKERLDPWSLDPEAVDFAVLELCENASVAGATQMTIRLSRCESFGIVRLQDNGSGLNDLDQRELAELRTLGVSRWKRSGLGLTVVDRCVVAHGGSFQLLPQTRGLLVELKFALGAGT